MSNHARILEISELYADGTITTAEFVAACKAASGATSAPPKRPKRKMPSTARIADHHGMPDETCWRCGQEGYVERAHLVDRVNHGLDGPQNLSLLCPLCHRMMPCFGRDEWEQAVEYAMPLDPGPHNSVGLIASLIGADKWERYIAELGGAA